MAVLEELFKPIVFERKIIEKIDEGVYRVNAGVSLYDSNILARHGYAVLIVTDKFITVAEAFFPPELKMIREGEAKVIEIYAVDMNRACEYALKLADKHGVKLSKTMLWWCNENIAIIE